MKSIDLFIQKNFWFLTLGMYVLYFLSRLINQTLLPVFADEAIYIRWAQLMNEDFGRYVFFPMNDGKPPLQMILLSRLLPFFKLDPLQAARTLSTLTGTITLGSVMYFVRILGGSKFASLLSGLLYIFVPFSLFHDRMGLIDSMLLMFLTLALIFFTKSAFSSSWKWVGGAGIFYGASLWTKTPAVFFIPIIVILFLLLVYKNKLPFKEVLIRFAVAGLIGIGIFLLLRLHPAFPSLFSRSEG